MLYIVATPIGNMEDITLRALKVLKEVDFIAAEDTRHTRGLLTRYEIKTRLVSFHEYSTPEKRAWLIEALRAGRSVALVSDAGTPLISDPGAQLVAEAAQAGLEITSLPGACAAVTAMTLSGFGGSFTFIGFLSKKAAEERKQIAQVAQSALPCILYESPHRLSATLEKLREACGDARRVAVAKELTKVYERVFRGSIAAACGEFAAENKGEYVIITGGAEKAPAEVSDGEVLALLTEYVRGGMTKKDAANAASEKLGVRRNRAYGLTSGLPDIIT
jgi:probable S-adenosylmethionine-dependent methyltransferase, YraL family